MIKNIIFDMGGVLLDWNPKKFLKHFDLTEEEQTLIYNTVFESYRWPLLDFGYYESEEAFLKEVLPQLPEKLRTITIQLVTNWDILGANGVPGMSDIVKKLKDNGYNLYLLSNAGPRHDEYWHNVPGSEYFDGKVVSALVKQFKPCADIYNTILSRYNLKAEECVFIDDVTVNCAGAFLAGIQPIVFRNAEDLVIELRKLNVRI